MARNPQRHGKDRQEIQLAANETMTNQAAYLQAKELVGEIERLLETLKEKLDQLAPAPQTEHKPSAYGRSLGVRHDPNLGSL